MIGCYAPIIAHKTVLGAVMRMLTAPQVIGYEVQVLGGSELLSRQASVKSQ